ncbi:hypothetical protein TRICI_002117 [Trichomonascus ciferrii]|uniref:Mediator of RNA polymerase II transcription subunit 4 n=1 Tax=Trichomonascus ciferrii TaxID=44093 RepID=A0A642V7S3_9ASCO|nr:hypothetical protein TRICI_002117 [Trichomonascus ciferrii]
MSSVPYSKVSTPNPAFESQFQLSRAQTPAPRMNNTVEAQNQQQQFPLVTDKLSIGRSLETYERIINELVESIGAFRPKKDLIPRLIEADGELFEAIDELAKHQEAGKKIKKLQSESDELSQKLNLIIIGLSDCRRQLQALPGRESIRDHDEETVSAKELLKYATKITKFTHAPPGYDPQMPEHANFPWPTEDELRRGTMALLAMNSEEDENLQAVDEKALNSIKNDNPSQQPPDNSNNNNTTTNANSTTTGKRRSSSLVSYGERPVVDPSAAPRENNNAVLDLDLFDPDEED